MPQKMVSERTGHHSFADRYAANADAGVMAPFNGYFSVLAANGDGFTRSGNGTGGLEGKPGDNILAGTYAA